MSGPALEIAVDPDLCIGTGNCVFFAPEVFEMTDAGQARVLDPAARSEQDVIYAAEQCPIRAVRVFRDGSQLV